MINTKEETKFNRKTTSDSTRRSTSRERKRKVNMQICKENLSSAAAINGVMQGSITTVIDRHRKASQAFADFLQERSNFDDSRRDDAGRFQEIPECASMDEKEDAYCDAERQAAYELADTIPASPQDAYLKLDYILSEHERGNRLYVDDELIGIVRSALDNGALHDKARRGAKRETDVAHDSNSLISNCPVYPLAKEFGRLAEKYNQLDAHEHKRRQSENRVANEWTKMVVGDRMSAIYDQASYLQSTSVVGAAFQAMIVKSHMDILTDTEGNEQRELKARMERLLYRAVRNLVGADDIARAQRYLMARHLDPFAVLEDVSAA